MDKAVYIWRTATGEQVRIFAGHREEALCLSFSPNGRMLASGSRDTFLVWEAER
jgi:WD40 repeat protein